MILGVALAQLVAPLLTQRALRKAVARAMGGA